MIEKLGTAGISQLGVARRRWLEYPPRSPDSGAKHRLEEVLGNMVRDGVLLATRTAKGAYVYSAGPNFDRYQQEVPV